MTTKEQRLAKFERIRERGFLSFVVRYGIIGFGVPTALLFALIMSLLSEDQEFLWWLGETLIISPFGGIAWGSIMWWVFGTQSRRVRHDSA